MQKVSFEQAVEGITEVDPRYQPEAYAFLWDALEFTRQKVFGGGKKEGHVSVAQLLEGIQEYALKAYGPMVCMVFEDWGIRSSSDFGNILWNLVEFAQFSVTEDDRREDFDDAFDFHEAFRKPFLPENRRQPADNAESQNT